MSRLMDDSATDEILTSSSPVNSRPHALSCWVYPDDLSVVGGGVTIGQSGSSQYVGQLLLTDGTLRIQNDNNHLAVTSNTATVNTWNHFYGDEAASNDRQSILNGDLANRGTNSSASGSIGGIDRVGIGVLARSSKTWHLSGRICEAAIWNARLSDAEVVALSKGYSPLFIKPGNLLAYWPLWGNLSPEPDIVGGYNGTLTGTAKAVHAPIVAPAPIFFPAPGSGAAPAGAALPRAPFSGPFNRPFGGPFG